MTGNQQYTQNTSRRADTRGSRGPRTRTGNEKARPDSSAGSKDSTYKESVALLIELFPEWTEEDLISLLTDLNGNVELACNQIADGQAKPWSMVGKKVPKPAPVPMQKPRNSRPPAFSKKNDASGAETAVPVAALDADLGWAVTEPPRTVADVIETELVEEFQRKVTVQEEKVEWHTEDSVCVQATVTEVVEETVVVITEVSEPVVAEEDSEDDDVYVRMPALSNRRQAALEIEPSAVVLPFSVPIKAATGIAFGASAASSGGKMVFGESKSTSVASAQAPSSSAAAPQKVYSPEELFASASRPATQPSTYGPGSNPTTTTSVDAAGSPPGLGVPKNPYQQHSSPRADYDAGSRRGPQGGYYGQQRYDAYQPHGYTQRYAPYGEEAFGAAQSAYYTGSAAAGRQQPGAGYYHHPHPYQGQYHPHAHLQQQHHHAYAPGPHVMYSNDPYGASAFAAPPAAPGSVPTTRYQSQSPQHSATQQQPYGSPGTSGRSRMF